MTLASVCYNMIINIPATFTAFGDMTKVHGGTSMSNIISGIYAIVNKNNGKRYIGSSFDIVQRWKRHARLLNTGKHHSTHLQNAWNKYGAVSFDFVILQECPECDLIVNEQRYIDLFNPEYNVSPTAGRTFGVIRSDEYRAKQSKSQSGKVISEETRQKISDGMKGKRNSLGTSRVVSQSTIEKIRSSLFGHSVSLETRQKISSKNKGYKHSEEARRKIGKASIGNKHNLGRVQSEEEKNKRAESIRLFWKNKKALLNEEAE